MKADRYNVTDLVPVYDIQCRIENLMIPMRDGVRLHTAVYFPLAHQGKSPVMIVRSPYCQTPMLSLPHGGCLKRGVIYILQACRGTGWSEGLFDPAERDQEMFDAQDLFAWLENQTWFNGCVAMTGASYPGWVQWCAARTGNPILCAIAPQVAPLYSCNGSVALGGGLKLSFTTHWMLSMHHRRTYGYAGVPDYEEMKIDWKLPVIDCDINGGYPQLTAVRKFIQKAQKPDELIPVKSSEFSNMRTPALVSGGWFDGFKEETITGFQLLKRYGATTQARNFTRLVIGPWGHGGLLNPDLFGAECDHRELNKYQGNFIFGLLDKPNQDPLPDVPVVKYYLLGENRWKTADMWPPAGGIERCWYLHSNGNANTSKGDGTLNRELPLSEVADVYVSDPNNPVLSNKGSHNSLGCYDRSNDELRNDMLVYTSDPLTVAVTVIGEVKVKFFASCSTPDTDFFATLTAVLPDGRSMLLTQGMIRARYRKGLDNQELVIPIEVAEYEISLGNIAVKFLRGFAIRLEIHGQDFPHYDRNANTGNVVATDTCLCSSIHTVYHDKQHPAMLIFNEYNF